MANMLRSLREAAGLSQAALADRINTTQSQIDRLEKGERRMTIDWMARLGSALGVDPIAIMPPAEPTGLNSAPPPPPLRSQMPTDVPVYGTAMGANGDGAFTINLTGQVDTTKRGPGIANSRGVFAIYVEGESMMPAFRPGAVLYLDKNRPISPGDDVVLVVESREKGEPPRAYLKRLVRRTADRWICEQFNPAKTVEFEVAALKEKFRVLTLNEVMGA